MYCFLLHSRRYTLFVCYDAHHFARLLKMVFFSLVVYSDKRDLEVCFYPFLPRVLPALTCVLSICLADYILTIVILCLRSLFDIILINHYIPL